MPKTSVKDKSEMVMWMPTSELLKKFDPDNPRMHDLEGDVPKICDSLLGFGWASTLTLQENGSLISGHGRCLAANELRQYTPDQFQLAWDEWIEVNPKRKEIADAHFPRFRSDFWENCPVTVIPLDDSSSKSLLIRLNNDAYDGVDSPEKIAAIIAKLPERLVETAGFSKDTARSYIDAYMEKAPSKPQVEFQPKQYFERPDATVYDGAGEVVDAETLATTDHIPEDWTVEVEGQSYTVDELEEQHGAEQEQQIALDDLDFSNFDDSFRGASVDKDIAETRIVLLVSKADLAEYNEKIGAIAANVGVSTEGSSKLWKPKTIMTLVRNAYVDCSQD